MAPPPGCFGQSWSSVELKSVELTSVELKSVELQSVELHSRVRVRVSKE